jgi:hypothetical protein
VKLAYADASRDYRAMQTEARTATAPLAIAESAAPLVMEEADARAAAEHRLQETLAASERAALALPPSNLALEPGDLIRLENRPWRIVRLSGRFRREAEVIRDSAAPRGTPLSLAEGTLGALPAVYGLPLAILLDTHGPQGPGLYAAAAADPWPGALALYAEGPGGMDRLATLDARATAGETVSALTAAPPHRLDRTGSLDVRLDFGTLSSVTIRAMLDGANVAAIEVAASTWEVIQFANAALAGPSTWRLSHLLRGQAGTEHNISASLAPGARFVLLDGAAARLGLAPDTEHHLRLGPAHLPWDDPAFARIAITVSGDSVLPWAPAHARAARAPNGDIALQWIRRARDPAGRWTSGEPPLGEDAERYQLHIFDRETLKRTVETGTPSFLYTAAMQAADFAAPPPALTLRLAQVSPVNGPGPARLFTLTL